MVRSKPGPSKKPKRGGVDFKKFKRKVGRKLPPPKNFTDTQIKSKALIVPEQSVASERAGLAVNRKGLPLGELLRQTSHHNAKTRKAALTGIKDLIQIHPSELELHKLAIIKKLRERICDNDKIVRETLYQLLETEIFRSKEDINMQVISLLMAYIFNAMTHMAIDIRLMAFKFFNLIVQGFPSSFILYAEKVLDNYIAILRNNEIYLQDKSKLKNVLDGLIRCLSSSIGHTGGSDSSLKSSVNYKRPLHSYENAVQKEHAGLPFVVKKLDDLFPILVNCLQESTSLIHTLPTIDAHSFDCSLKTLQCVNLAVKVLINEIHTSGESFAVLHKPLSDGHDLMKSAILLHLKKFWELFPIGNMHSSTEKEDEKYFTLNVRIVEIFMQLIEMINNDPSVPILKFLDFIEGLLLGQIGDGLPSNKVVVERHFGLVIPFIPKVVSQVSDSWAARLLEGFTAAFKACKVDSKLCLVYLSAIKEMLLPVHHSPEVPFLSADPHVSNLQKVWIRELPKILLNLGDKHSSVSKFVLKLILGIGQRTPLKSPISPVYNDLQYTLKDFYSTKGLEGEVYYGPFIKLPRDCQELAICSLYYFSSLGAEFLEALTCCCLCDRMEEYTLLRIVSVLQLAYKDGFVKISDQIGFLFTLVARFKFYPEKCIMEFDGHPSNRGTFIDLTTEVCSCLSEMGDGSLVLMLLWKNLCSEMSLKPSMDNMYGILKIIYTLDKKLPEENISIYCKWLFVYLLEAASGISEHVGGTSNTNQISVFQYYMRPCIFLFRRSDKLLCHVLKLLDSFIMEDNLSSLALSGNEYAPNPFNRACVVCSILIYVHDDRLKRSLSSCDATIICILQKLLSLLDSSEFSITFEEKHKLRTTFDQLKSRACELLHLNTINLEKL